MKKCLLFAIAVATLLLTSIDASAQKKTNFNGWTVKLGTNFSNIIGNSDFDVPSKYKVGFTAGLGLDWLFTNVVGLSVDVLYSRQGGEFDLGKGIKVVENSNYINVPVLANFHIVKGLVGKAGVQLGFFLSGDDRIEGTENPQNYDMIGAYRTMDVAIPVGLSYEFGFGLIIDARYHFGLTDIIKDAPYEKGLKATNSYASLTVGYRF